MCQTVNTFTDGHIFVMKIDICYMCNCAWCSPTTQITYIQEIPKITNSVTAIAPIIVAKVPILQVVLLFPMQLTPARTHSISGLKSRVMKSTFLTLKRIVKRGLEFILKFTEPLQRYLLTCQANSAQLGRFFGTGQQQLWRGSVDFKIKNSRLLFTIILSQKCKFQDSRF